MDNDADWLVFCQQECHCFALFAVRCDVCCVFVCCVVLCAVVLSVVFVDKQGCAALAHGLPLGYVDESNGARGARPLGDVPRRAVWWWC